MSVLAPIMGIYGKSKIGKTSQLIELCANAEESCIITGNQSALLAGKTFLGLSTMNTVQVENVVELRKRVKELAKKYRFFGIDDLTLLIKRSGTNWKELNKNIIGLIYEDCIPIRDKYGTCFCITTHEQEERLSSNRRVRGGPEMPGQAPEEFSGYLDVVLRAVSEESMELWPFVYWSVSRTKWIAGDRLSVFPDMCPMNVCEGLRLYGLSVPRAKGNEWQDGLAAKVAGELSKLEDLTTWRDTVKPLVVMAQNKDPSKYTLPLLKWAIRDALHRVIYQRAKSIDKWLDIPDNLVIA